MVISTVAGCEAAWPSLTTSEKVSVPDTPGAVKEGFALVGLLRDTVVPPV
jgi:hypothetical protein